MPRLPLVDPATAPEDVREALAAMPPTSAMFRMVAHAETAFRPWLVLAGILQTSLTLDAKVRQLAIMRVAVLARCEYELVHHRVISQIEGLRPEQIEALAAGRDSGPEFDERESLVLRFVSEAVEQRGASEETTSELAELFTPRDIVELLLVVWQYLGLALLVNSTGIEAEPPLDPEEILAARARRAALSQQAT
jgi:AhpD family alkylhydroperoxidase